MDPPPAIAGERTALSRGLADIAVRREAQPELWRGYFERLLSGRTIGPLPFDDGRVKIGRHAIAGQCAFALEAPETNGLTGPAQRWGNFASAWRSTRSRKRRWVWICPPFRRGSSMHG